MTDDLEIEGLACSVFRPELELLDSRGELDLPVSYVDSRLHMQPSLLEETLRSRVDALLRPGVGVVLLFGDCHPGMHHLCASRHIARLDGLNCAMMLLGRERYLDLMRQRAFLVFPEWAVRWRDVVLALEASCDGAGLCFLRDAHQKLTYLDTGARPVPEDELAACSASLGLPFEVVSVSLDHLGELICRARATLCRTSATDRSAEV